LPVLVGVLVAVLAHACFPTRCAPGRG
jgi:hypothetical protein